jgi:hypothetical protein
MKRLVRKAIATDLPVVFKLIESGRKIMRESGNPNQWGKNHPSTAQLQKDIEDGHSYLLMDRDKAIATFAFIPGPDVTYAKIYDGAWIDTAKPYYVIHRVASLPDYHGVMKDILDYCFSITDNIRIDTHRDNKPMQHCLVKYGFHYCGIIHLLDGDERLAYQKLL